MLTIPIIVAIPLAVWGILALVVRLLPPPATHLPQSSDSPSRQLDLMGVTRVRTERARDGSRLRMETFKCPRSGATYLRTTRS